MLGVLDNKRTKSICLHCTTKVRDGMKAVSGEWHHDKCIDITGSNFALIKRRNITWKCNVCIDTVKAVGTGLERELAFIFRIYLNY